MLERVSRQRGTDEELGALINALPGLAEPCEYLPCFVSAFEGARSLGPAVLLIRHIRSSGRVAEILPELVRIVDGVSWDADRRVWLVALRTLARHARDTRDSNLTHYVRLVSRRRDLTDLQLTWARRCGETVRGER
ncbi:hypothetical protein [Haloactinospora alba]|nr:hypothetical protein [Haloactinospora alba]